MPSAYFLRRRSIFPHLLRLATRWFAFRHSLSLSLYISWSCNRAGNYTASSQAMQRRLIFVFNIFVRPEPFFRRKITKHSDLEPPILQHCVLRQIFSPFHPLVQLPCDEWVVESYFNNVCYNFSLPHLARAVTGSICIKRSWISETMTEKESACNHIYVSLIHSPAGVGCEKI